jgi:putative ABC transport system permease protein
MFHQFWIDLRVRLAALFGRRGLYARADEELQFHLAMREQRLIESGVRADEARRRARSELGNAALLTELSLDSWRYRFMDTLIQDVRCGLRQMRRNPGFSAIAIATLALGIGGITAMFSAFDAILIRPLPYADADRLVMVWDMLKASNPKSFPTPAEWIEWRRLNTVFTDLAATQAWGATLSGDSEVEQVSARKTTASLWSVLGVRPLIGRVFTESEDEGGVKVVVISHGLWQRRFGGSPGVLGRKIAMNDSTWEIVGVMPRDFYFLPGPDIDVWMPSSFSPSIRRNFAWHDSQIVARLKPGVTLEQAGKSMDALSLQVTAKDFRGPHRVLVTRLREEIAGKTQTVLVLLLGASSALLMIACVNIANLLMSRATVRGREVAIRTALGAGRGRLAAQFLTEGVVLAALGSVAGLILAIPAMRFLATLAPESMGAVRLSLDWRVLAFSAAVAIAATLAFGLAPAVRGSRSVPQNGLRDGGRGATGPRSHWFQHALIVVETALAVVLLTSGGLMLQTFRHLRNADLGMHREKLLTFEAPLFRYGDFEKRVAYVNALIESIRAVPGVIDAGASTQLPLRTSDTFATFYLLEGQAKDRYPSQVALMRVVTRDYFATLGARLREGRFFDASDRRSGSPAAVVNETFANLHFPGRSAIGARFKYGQLNEKGYWYTIAGVVKEVREVSMAEEPRPVVYRLHDQTDQVGSLPSSFVVRTALDPSSIVPAVRQAVWSVDKNQPIWRFETLETILSRQLSTPAQGTALLTAFAALALLLASVGFYGVLSFAVAQRTNEIGVRMALGATSRAVLVSFVQRGLVLTVAGLAIGLVLSAVSSRLMTNLLYGFRPDYAPAVIATSVVLLGVAALACFVPARRASRVDPAIALRNE